MSTKKSDDVKNVISRLMGVYGFHKTKEAADLLGVTSQVLSNWIKRNSPKAVDKIKEIVNKDKQEWILTGKAPQARGWLPIFDTLLQEFGKLPEAEQYRVIADLIERGKSLRKKEGNG